METSIPMLLGSVADSIEVTLKLLGAVTALAGALAGVLTAIAAVRRRSDRADSGTTSGHRRPSGPTDGPKPGAAVVVELESSVEQRWHGGSIPPSPKVVAIPNRQGTDRWYQGKAEEDDPNLWTGKAKASTPSTIQSKHRSNSSRWWTRTDESALVGPGGSRHGTN
jgi:hypothetical protein